MITLSNLVDLEDNYLLEQYGKEVTMTATSKYYQKVQGQILFLGCVRGHFFATPCVEVRLDIFIDPGSNLGSRVRYSRHYSNGEG
jgi:hypothetical protein